MYVIMVYDVGVDRVQKVLKIGRKHLTHVQNSVLEGEMTPNRLRSLQKEVRKVVDRKNDTVLFYTVRSSRLVKREEIGVETNDPGQNIL